MGSILSLPLLVVAVTSAVMAAIPPRVFVADIGPNSITIAWGTADGRTTNTIGKGAAGIGKIALKIDGKTIDTTASWYRVEGLKPDTKYDYTVLHEGTKIGEASVRTWPEKAESLTFFAIGDFGNASAAQLGLARRMENERIPLDKTKSPARFVLGLGDNIYGKLSSSGNKDLDWERKYFAPYAGILSAIPFKAVIGNHDGNESESTGDLAVCLDNFFMPARWYSFQFGGLAEFYALDSTTNQPQGRPAPVYSRGGEQSKWLADALAKPRLPWRIAFMHHPMFTAGPRHESKYDALRHWFDMFKTSGVQTVFAGHEHNLQLSERNSSTGGMQFVVSGAGGELRTSDVRRAMPAGHIAAWANQNHFLIVEITPTEMTVQPVGLLRPINLRDAGGNSVTQPVRIGSISGPQVTK